MFDLVYVWDFNYCFIYVNCVLLQMWGKIWDEVIGKNCFEFGYEFWYVEMYSCEIEQVCVIKCLVWGDVFFNGIFGCCIYDYIIFFVFGFDGEVEVVVGIICDVIECKNSEVCQYVLFCLVEVICLVGFLGDIVSVVVQIIGDVLIVCWVSYKLLGFVQQVEELG